MTRRLRPGDPGVPRYLSRVPEPGAVPAGMVLVHNHVRQVRRLGSRGFRAWLQASNDRLEVCPCDWAPELGPHYWVRRHPPRAAR
jgi:hypothetical protein